MLQLYDSGENSQIARLFGAPWLWWLDRDWTWNPISVQTLSMVCLIVREVQGLSSHVQSRSKVCRVPVQFKGSWTKIGLRNPGFVQTISNENSSELKLRIFLPVYRYKPVQLIYRSTGKSLLYRYTLPQSKFLFHMALLSQWGRKKQRNEKLITCLWEI